MELLAAVDWPSFGYGAGALAVSTYAWSARGPLTRGVIELRRRAAVRRFQRATLARRLDSMEQTVGQLHARIAQQSGAHLEAEQEIARLRKKLLHLLEQDVKWRRYQARKRGVHEPTGQDIVQSGDGTVERVHPLFVCRCGHFASSHEVAPGGCGKGPCQCRDFKLFDGQRRVRLDGQGYAGDLGTHCGRTACVLGHNHDGTCTV